MKEEDSLLKIQELADNLGLVISAAIIMTASLLLGMSNLFSTITLEYYRTENATNLIKPLTEEEGTLFVSIMSASGTVGVASSPFIGDLIGRKKTILFTSMLYIIGFTTMYLAKTAYILLFGRLITGLASGISKVQKAMYLCEVATIRWRGLLSTINLLTIISGCIISICLGAFMSYYNFIIAMIVPPTLFLIFSLFLQESPVWLVKKGDVKGAKQTLRKLRGKNYPLDIEMEELEHLTRRNQKIPKERDANENGGSNNRDDLGSDNIVLTSPEVWKPTLVSSLLFILQVNCGDNTLNYYSFIIFEMANYWIDKHILAILMQIAFTVGYLLSILCIVVVKRRTLLMVSSISYAACFVYLGATLNVQTSTWPQLQAILNIIHPLVLLLGCTIFAMGIISVAFALFGEIYPLKFKSECSTVAFTIRELTIFITLEMFPVVTSNFGLSGVFYLNGFFGLVICIFGYFFLPETKDLSLTEISTIYQQNGKTKFSDSSN